ncbi:MAG: NAD-dependent epimerase/dehydratase family protein [Melioribacteraceae bacterium]
MSKKIFITGGSGFLGKRIIERLKKESFIISGLARSEKSIESLRELNVEPIKGSLENIDEWKTALNNIDILIHCAAPVELWGNWKKFNIGIVQATKKIYQVAEENKVSRFIYISSESVLQDKKDLIDIDETEPYPKEPNSYYGKSKMLAEKFIQSQNGKMESIILRPTFIWGKGVKALDTIIAKINSKDFMWINNGENLLEMVHVDNVAEAVYLSLSKGVNKNIYFVTDDNSQTVKKFLTKLIQTRGVVVPNKNLPKSLALFIATIMEFLWKILNLKSTPMITKFDVAFVAMSRKYNISKIKNEMNYAPIILEQEELKSMKV